MGDSCDIGDRVQLQTHGFDGPEGSFPAWSWSIDEGIRLPDTHAHGFLDSVFRSQPGCECSAPAGPL